MIHPTNPDAVRVKRDGPRGWHWIDASSFDPAVHELMDPDQNSEPVEAKKRGRPSKKAPE